jgi:hypothetical protein
MLVGSNADVDEAAVTCSINATLDAVCLGCKRRLFVAFDARVRGLSEVDNRNMARLPPVAMVDNLKNSLRFSPLSPTVASGSATDNEFAVPPSETKLASSSLLFLLDLEIGMLSCPPSQRKNNITDRVSSLKLRRERLVLRTFVTVPRQEQLEPQAGYVLAALKKGSMNIRWTGLLFGTVLF